MSGVAAIPSGLLMMSSIGPGAAAATGGLANAIRETANVSPRAAVMPAMPATDFRSDATWAAGTDLSTTSARSILLILPGATTLRWTVLSTPNVVVPVLWL